MNMQDREKFLRDFVSFLRRHGPKPFLELASALSDPERREDVVQGLTTLAEIAQESEREGVHGRKASRRPTEDQRARSLLASLRVSDPRKADLLTQLYDPLKSRKLLPSRGDVLQFCSQLGVHVSPRAQRNKLLLPILHHLAEVSFEEIGASIEKASAMSRDKGEDFQLLANAIMKRSRSVGDDPSEHRRV